MLSIYDSVIGFYCLGSTIIIKLQVYLPQLRLGMDIFKLVVRYLLTRKGVLAPGRPTLLAHA